MAKQRTYRSTSTPDDTRPVIELESDALPVLTDDYEDQSDDAESGDKDVAPVYDNASDPSVARYFADVQQYSCSNATKKKRFGKISSRRTSVAGGRCLWRRRPWPP